MLGVEIRPYGSKLLRAVAQGGVMGPSLVFCFEDDYRKKARLDPDAALFMLSNFKY